MNNFILLSKPFYTSNHFEQYYVIFNKPLFFQNNADYIMIKLNSNIIFDGKIEKINIYKHFPGREYPVDSYYINLEGGLIVDFLVDSVNMEILCINIVQKFENFYTELKSPYITPYTVHSEWHKTIDIVEIYQYCSKPKI
jgi:hypothetical protein